MPTSPENSPATASRSHLSGEPLWPLGHSGVGSLPGTDIAEALRYTLGELGGTGLPYLPELPARGPGADLIGRSAALLVDLAVDLQPAGWRLVPRPGRDLERSRSWWHEDLDALAEVADGYRGPLKLQVTGPWTLAAALRLERLERAVVDAGACRDLVDSLAEGTARHLAQVSSLLPDAQIVLQLDEPSLPSVLNGTLSTASGFGRLRAIEEHMVVEGLRRVLAAATGAGAVETVIHCCADDAPLDLFTRCGAAGFCVDTTRAGARQWERIAAAVEAGSRLWAGAVPTGGAGTEQPKAVAERVMTAWTRVGLSPAAATGIVLTPACGLAGADPAGAHRILRTTADAARILAEQAQA